LLFAGGGIVLAGDTEEFGVSGDEPEATAGEGRFLALPKVQVAGRGPRDLAEAYLRTYDYALRERIASIVTAHIQAIAIFEMPGADRTTTGYPYLQLEEKRMLIHLVNSDYDAEAFRMRPKQDIVLRIRRPAFYERLREAHIYSPDFPDGASDSVMPELQGDFIRVHVPRLEVCAVIVL